MDIRALGGRLLGELADNARIALLRHTFYSRVGYFALWCAPIGLVESTPISGPTRGLGGEIVPGSASTFGSSCRAGVPPKRVQSQSVYGRPNERRHWQNGAADHARASQR